MKVSVVALNFPMVMDTSVGLQTNRVLVFFQVLPTEKPGYFFLSWSDYGLELKRRYEENSANQQRQSGATAAPEGAVPIFKRLVEYTQEIELHEGENIQVISPFMIRLKQLENPPSSIQGNHSWEYSLCG